MTDVTELYRMVYRVVRDEASKEESSRTPPAPERHRQFALALPDPVTISAEDAAALCSLVIVSGEWGLEGFYSLVAPDGTALGEYVRLALPNYADYQERARVLVREITARLP